MKRQTIDKKLKHFKVIDPKNFQPTIMIHDGDKNSEKEKKNAGKVARTLRVGEDDTKGSDQN